MVTINSDSGIPIGSTVARHAELIGKSTDDKPTALNGAPIPENSLFLELDTLNLFYLENGTWVQCGS